MRDFGAMAGLLLSDKAKRKEQHAKGDKAARGGERQYTEGNLPYNSIIGA